MEIMNVLLNFIIYILFCSYICIFHIFEILNHIFNCVIVVSYNNEWNINSICGEELS